MKRDKNGGEGEVCVNLTAFCTTCPKLKIIVVLRQWRI